MCVWLSLSKVFEMQVVPGVDRGRHWTISHRFNDFRNLHDQVSGLTLFDSFLAGLCSLGCAGYECTSGPPIPSSSSERIN
mmetsp:Transcript_23914/g.27915  ORF Transcript_23914/g.27915 Transcript_23914/m.27915 type:complete len:80 (-) Transcript_23914:69-308(-)